jgi:hypothetical protein
VNAKLIAHSRPMAAALLVSACFSTSAFAGSKTDRVAQAAKACANTVCKLNPTGKAFGAAVRASDRLGWEVGRHQSIKRYGTDPGKYPGFNR